MKIIWTGVLLSALFLCLLFAVPVAHSDTIQYGNPFTTRPYIVYPTNNTYSSAVQTLNVSFHAQIWGNFNYSMTYSLDGQEKTPLLLTQHYFGMFNQDENYIDGSVNLPTLFGGSHIITVYLTCTQETLVKTGSLFHTYLDADHVFFGTTVTSQQQTFPLPTTHSTYHHGDPYTTIYYPTEIPSPNETKSPTITIITPTNNTLYGSNNLTLSFNLAMESPSSFYPITLQALTYKPSWKSDNFTIDTELHSPFINKTLPLTIDLTNIPEGNHTVTVTASTLYEYETGRENFSRLNTPTSIIRFQYLYIYSNYYTTTGTSTVNFTINTIPTTTPRPSSNNNLSSDYGTDTFLYATGIVAAVILVVIVGIFVYSKKRS